VAPGLKIGSIMFNSTRISRFVNLIEPLLNQPRIRPTRVSYDRYYWSTNHFRFEKQVLRFVFAKLAERYASDKIDSGSSLVLANSNRVIFHFSLSLCPHPLFGILWKSLLNHYWTLLDHVFNSINKEPWSRDSWIWPNSTVRISWFVDMSQLMSRLLSSQPWFILVYKSIFGYIQIYIHIYMYIYIYMHMYICMYICSCTQMHTYIFMCSFASLEWSAVQGSEVQGAGLFGVVTRGYDKKAPQISQYI
jgi:hypothetical protein